MVKNFKIVICILICFCCVVSVFGRESYPVREHFVLVHGAWHGAWCWYKIAYMLEREGHTVSVLDLPGHGLDFSDAANITLDDYRDKIIALLDSIPQQVILVGHSMGGIVLSMVAEARPNQIKKMIYLSAYLVMDGQSLLDVALQDYGSVVLSNLIIQPEEGLIDVYRENLKEMFYNCSPAKDVKLAQTLIRPTPLGPLFTPVFLTNENYGSVERFYIYTCKDNAISYSVQKMMVANSPCRAVFALDTDHSSFFSKPNGLIKIINKIVRGRY